MVLHSCSFLACRSPLWSHGIRDGVFLLFCSALAWPNGAGASFRAHFEAGIVLVSLAFPFLSPSMSSAACGAAPVGSAELIAVHHLCTLVDI